jgi:NADH-quinone oxidoreductase subunit A
MQNSEAILANNLLQLIIYFGAVVAITGIMLAGFIEALIFIGVLIAALIYLWSIGALDWRTRRQRIDSSDSRS